MKSGSSIWGHPDNPDYVYFKNLDYQCEPFQNTSSVPSRYKSPPSAQADPDSFFRWQLQSHSLGSHSLTLEQAGSSGGPFVIPTCSCVIDTCHP